MATQSNSDGSESTDCPCPNCGLCNLTMWLDEPDADDYGMWVCLCGWQSRYLPEIGAESDANSINPHA